MPYKLSEFFKGKFIFIILVFVLLKLLIHLPFNQRFGFHADELLHLAMADQLDWGYKEGPPFIAVMVWLSVKLFGTSLWALRLVPTLCGALIVFFTGIMTRNLGGSRLAVIIACTAILFAPSFLVSAYMMQPVIFDQLFWVISIWLILSYLKTGRAELLLWLGLVVGLGMMNKFTIALYLFTLLIALYFSPHRKMLFNKYWFFSACIGLLLFFPHLLWQIQHHFPVVQHFKELRIYYWAQKDTIQLINEFIFTHGASGIVCFSGIFFAGLSPLLRNYRFIVTSFVLLQLILLILHAKTYYAFGAFPVLFAAGGIGFEQLFNALKKPWLRIAFFSTLIMSGLIIIPAVVPVLSLKNTVFYFKSMVDYTGSRLPLKWEDGKYHSINQYYAQMIGWEVLAKKTAVIYRELPQKKQLTAVILTDNYQQSGAISHFGKSYRFPPSFSSKPSFFSKSNPQKPVEYIILITSKINPDLLHQTKLISQHKIIEPYGEINGSTIYLLRIPI